MARWLLVDGFNLIYRCYFATPALTRSDGFPTNALHGWIKSLWRLLDQERPTHTVVFFDLGGSQDRLALHPEYKAQRAEMPVELSKQIPFIKELTHALGLGVIEQDGVESDDLLATCAVLKSGVGDEVLIVSSDKDFAQIVGERIRVLLPPPSAQPKMGWRLLDAAGVEDKFGVPPSLIPDYLALVGDTSDNIPGLAGVGPKTAIRWLTRYGGLAGVISAAAEIEPERFRIPLAESATRLTLNLRLVTLNLRLSLPAHEQRNPDLAALKKILEEMGMKSTLAEVGVRYEQGELF